MQYSELYNIDKQLCDWIWKLICKYQNFTSFAANCTIWNYSCKKLVNTNMLNVDSKDTVSCIWLTSFRNWKHNYKYFIKSNCKIRNTICRKAKWYTQDTEIIYKWKYVFGRLLGRNHHSTCFMQSFISIRRVERKVYWSKCQNKMKVIALLKMYALKLLKHKKNPEL